MKPVPDERALGEVDQPMYLLEVCVQGLQRGHEWHLDPMRGMGNALGATGGPLRTTAHCGCLSGVKTEVISVPGHSGPSFWPSKPGILIFREPHTHQFGWKSDLPK